MVEIDSEKLQEDIQSFSKVLDDINTSAQDVTQLIENLIRKVDEGELNTKEGLSFLEMKNMSLLSYLMNTTLFIHHKLNGKKMENDPCIERLAELRTVLEKVRPIDQKLKFQIDRLIQSSNQTDDVSKKFKPNLNAAMSDDDDEEEDDDESDDGEESAPKSKSGVYVPPKLSSVHYPGDVNAFERNKRLQEKSKKHALSSAIIQDLAEEYLDTPVELHQGSRAQQKLTKQQKERQEYEEENFTRLPMTKAEKHQNNKLTTLGVLGTEVTDYRGGSSQSKKKRKQNFKPKGKGGKRKKFSR